MISVSIDKCVGCKECYRVCPMDAIKIIDKKAVIDENCVDCQSCIKVCKLNALEVIENTNSNSVVCANCGVRCNIPNGKMGACKRFTNDNGSLFRNRLLQIPDNIKPDKEKIAISKPLITAVGAGASYPDYHPAPYIVEENIYDYDVVTVVTEAPVSYSTMLV